MKPNTPTAQVATKLSATEWLKYFERSAVLAKELAETQSALGKAIKIGQFLSTCVDREVCIQVGGKTGRACLRFEAGRANAKRYYVEVVWDDTAPPEPTGRVAKTPSSDAAKPRRKKSKTVERPNSEEQNAAGNANGKKAKPRQPGGNTEAWT